MYIIIMSATLSFHSIPLHDIRHQIFLSFFVHLHIIFHSSGSGIWSRNSTTSAMVFICLKHLTINYPRVVLNSPTTQYDRGCLTSNNLCNKTPKQRQHITPIHLYLYSIKGVQFNLSTISIASAAASSLSTSDHIYNAGAERIHAGVGS